MLVVMTESSTATELNEIFSRYQPCQYGMNFQHFKEYLHLCHQA